MMKWIELKKLGVKRCDAVYMIGGQCRRRVDRNAEPGSEHFCKRCGPKIAAALAPHIKAIAQAAKSGESV